VLKPTPYSDIFILISLEKLVLSAEDTRTER